MGRRGTEDGGQISIPVFSKGEAMRGNRWQRLDLNSSFLPAVPPLYRSLKKS
jgi:hypothetical protein